jgi:hypothetical protein
MSSTQKMNRRLFVAGIAGVSVVSCLKPSTLLGAPRAEPGLPSIWGNGQLFAFSALDGTTDYVSGLIARSMNQPAGLSIVHPAQAEIHWGERVTGPLQITSDTFLLSTDNCTVRGAFLDAHHLLIKATVVLASCPSHSNPKRVGGAHYLVYESLGELDVTELRFRPVRALP